jgi:hypothetical protein
MALHYRFVIVSEVQILRGNGKKPHFLETIGRARVDIDFIFSPPQIQNKDCGGFKRFVMNSVG